VGKPRKLGRNRGEVISTNTCNIAETVQDETKVTMRFQLAEELDCTGENGYSSSRGNLLMMIIKSKAKWTLPSRGIGGVLISLSLAVEPVGG